MEYFQLGDKRFVPEPAKQYWRVNHDKTLWRPNLPEVFPFEPSHYSLFSRGYQLLEKSLNSTMTNLKWRSLHFGGNPIGSNATAFNNRQGFDMDDDPRADWVNLRNLLSPLPKHEALVCGGAILLEKRRDANYLYPEYLDANKPAPTLKYIKENPHFFFDALSIDGGLNGTFILRRFPQGKGERVYVLLLANREIRIPLNKVTKLPLNSILPSPYQYP